VTERTDERGRVSEFDSSDLLISRRDELPGRFLELAVSILLKVVRV